MDDEKYIWKHKIKNCYELFDLIQGSGEIEKIHKKCIFRGIKKESYPLCPKSLRNNGADLNEAISPMETFPYIVTKDQIRECSIPEEDLEKYGGEYYLRTNKYYETPKDLGFDDISLNRLQIKKECNVLMKFIDHADKAGLKININKDIRDLIDNSDFYYPEDCWPRENFYEIIGLAQHYGMPTRFLDWSYNYKASIYFAVSDILEYKDDDYEEADGILWAFNYKLFYPSNPKNNRTSEKFKLGFYRPEYYSNPNLNAQKGLFTFILNDLYNKDEKSFDDIIIDDFKKNTDNDFSGESLTRSHGLTDSDIPEGEKIFYKFIIPSKLKPIILEEICEDNYSEEFLFPGYGGVAMSVKNKVILDELLMKSKGEFESSD